MLLVNTRLGLSNIHRIGLFADQVIPRDTIIWRYQPGYDIRIDPEFLKTLPLSAQKQILHYGYLNNGMYVLCSDDARYFNHSNTPNTYEKVSDDGEGLTISSQDIQIGEEITCNYHDFDDDDAKKLSNSNIPF